MLAAAEEEVKMDSKQKKQLPTKSKMAEMFARLETFIKGEIATLHEDMHHIIKRVEDTEGRLDTQGEEIKNLKAQVNRIQLDQRHILYKIEDHENRNRRKNLRIRGLPEIQGEKEDLQEKMEGIFGHMVRRGSKTSKIKYERIHRIRKPPEIAGDVPRDVIARFHNFQDKEQIRACLKNNQSAKYGETTLQIFPDLAAETLARRRILQPLLVQLKASNVQYSWGFPACLTGRKDGRSVVLRFPEDTPNFCERLNVHIIEIPGWWEQTKNPEGHEVLQSWQPVINLERSTARKK